MGKAGGALDADRCLQADLFWSQFHQSPDHRSGSHSETAADLQIIY